MNIQLAWRVVLSLGILLTISACGAPAAGLEYTPAVPGSENDDLVVQVVGRESAPQTSSQLVGVRTPETDDASPVVSISPVSGPPGTLVRVVGTGFLPDMPVMVGVGPEGEGFAKVAQGTTDRNGVFAIRVPAQGDSGMRLVFAISAERQSGAFSPVPFRVVDAPELGQHRQ